ncbi:MAG: hypothetical protein R3208_22630 [Ketobacteraceae bacterium]|nr:hypothetical protein [Ketobacteraceae bacterium]
MIRRKITEDFTLRQFRKRFEALSGQELPTHYLQSSNVYGFFMQGKLVAGFAVRTEPGLRHFELLEQAGVTTAALRSREEAFCELACLWISPRVRSPVFRMNFYLTCVADAVQTGREFILGGSPVADIVPTQQICLPYTLYSGPVAGNGDGPWTIYYGTRWTCLKGVALQFPGRVRDILKALPGDHHPRESGSRPVGRWHRVTRRFTGR